MLGESRDGSLDGAIAHTLLALEHGERVGDEKRLEGIVRSQGADDSGWDAKTVVGLQELVFVLLNRLETATGKTPQRTLQEIAQCMSAGKDQ